MYLLNKKTYEKISLEDPLFSIGSFTDSDIKLDTVEEIQIIFRKKEDLIIIFKGCGTLLVNNKNIEKKILHDQDEINIEGNIFVFSNNSISDENDNFEPNSFAIPEFNFIEAFDGINIKTNDSESKEIIENLIAINKFSQKINSQLETKNLLSLIIEDSLNIVKAEKGFILIKEEKEGLVLKSSFNLEEEINDLETFNKELVKKVIELINTEENTFSINKLNIKKYPNIKSLLSVKLKSKNQNLGFLCLLNSKKDGEFSDKQKKVLKAIMPHASIAIENSNLYEKVKYETSIRKNLQRYLPRNAIAKLINNQSNLSLKGEAQVCSILFSDICGFTSLSEKLSPKQVVQFLNEYLTVMTRVIFAYNGSIDKFIGDGVLAVFGAPIATPNHPLEACLAAIEMKKHIPLLAEQFKKKFNIPEFNIRIGINTGPVIYGNVGAPQRMDFTVIGDNVNLAARLESNAPKGGVLISKSTYEKVSKLIIVKKLDDIKVKGKRDPVSIFEVIKKKTVTESLSKNNSKVRINDKGNFRIEDRIPIKLSVSISREEERIQGLIKDISKGGVSIGSVGEFRTGEEVYLTFRLKNIDFKNLKSKIKYVKQSKQRAINNKPHVEMGIEFLALKSNEKEFLIKFVEVNSKRKR